MPVTEGQPGSREHAALTTLGRHPGVQDAVQWLCFSHLPEQLQRFSRPFYEAAQTLIQEVHADSPELTTALNTLVAAKDHGVRAGIRSDYGAAGPVPRPATVVDPPRRPVMPTVDGIRGHMVFTPEEDEARRDMALSEALLRTPRTDWPQTAQDLISGDDERIARHMPPQWRENWPTTPAQAVKEGFTAARPIHHYDDPEA